MVAGISRLSALRGLQLKEILEDETAPLPVRQTCELAVEALCRKAQRKKARESEQRAEVNKGRELVEKREEGEPGVRRDQQKERSTVDPLKSSSAGLKSCEVEQLNEEYQWFRHEEDNEYRDLQFNTVDPSEPYPDCTSRDIPWLAQQLMNPQEKLWNR